MTEWNNMDSETDVNKKKMLKNDLLFKGKWMRNIELGREINEKMKNEKILVYT